jgi:hypothetical protein
LQKKAEAFLFGSRDVGVNVPPDVHLQITIMQTADESLFIVHGSAITQTPEDQGNDTRRLSSSLMAVNLMHTKGPKKILLASYHHHYCFQGVHLLFFISHSR